jgi:hypothetical protein
MNKEEMILHLSRHPSFGIELLVRCCHRSTNRLSKAREIIDRIPRRLHLVLGSFW